MSFPSCWKENKTKYLSSANSWTPVLDILTAQFTFQHPQDDVSVVHVCSVHTDCVGRVAGKALWQCCDLAEGSMLPLCGCLWFCSRFRSDILLRLLDWHWQHFMFQWVYTRRRYWGIYNWNENKYDRWKIRSKQTLGYEFLPSMPFRFCLWLCLCVCLWEELL